jgi:hypothetical protein
VNSSQVPCFHPAAFHSVAIEPRIAYVFDLPPFTLKVADPDVNASSRAVQMVGVAAAVAPAWVLQR